MCNGSLKALERSVRQFLGFCDEAEGGWEEHEKERTSPEVTTKEKAEHLRAIAGRFMERHEFKVGDIVTQKSGAKISKVPTPDCPGIVLQILKLPVIADDSTRSSGIPEFLEPLDIVVGVIHPGEKMLRSYYFDSRRLEPLNLDD